MTQQTYDAVVEIAENIQHISRQLSQRARDYGANIQPRHMGEPIEDELCSEDYARIDSCVADIDELFAGLTKAIQKHRESLEDEEEKMNEKVN